MVAIVVGHIRGIPVPKCVVVLHKEKRGQCGQTNGHDNDQYDNNQLNRLVAQFVWEGIQ